MWEIQNANRNEIPYAGYGDNPLLPFPHAPTPLELSISLHSASLARTFLARPSGTPCPCFLLEGCSLSLDLPHLYHLALLQSYPVSVQMSLP